MDYRETAGDEDTAGAVTQPCGCGGYGTGVADTRASAVALHRRPAANCRVESGREPDAGPTGHEVAGLPSRLSVAEARLEQASATAGQAYAALAAELVTNEQRRLLLDYADAEAESAVALAEQDVQRLIAQAGHGLGPFLQWLAERWL